MYHYATVAVLLSRSWRVRKRAQQTIRKLLSSLGGSSLAHGLLGELCVVIDKHKVLEPLFAVTYVTCLVWELFSLNSYFRSVHALRHCAVLSHRNKYIKVLDAYSLYIKKCIFTSYRYATINNFLHCFIFLLDCYCMFENFRFCLRRSWCQSPGSWLSWVATTSPLVYSWKRCVSFAPLPANGVTPPKLRI